MCKYEWIKILSVKEDLHPKFQHYITLFKGGPTTMLYNENNISDSW
jgi:hypothetical protein